MGRSTYTFNTLTKLWPLGKVVYWMGSRPVLGSLLQPLFNALDHESILIPVNQIVHGTESVVLPYPLIEPLVARASKRFVMDRCMCRQGENCSTYPHDIGCLFLGDGVGQINPKMGRMVTVDEALAHAERAMDAGLMPSVVHTAFDAWMLGVPYRQMLGICFCCECCCAVWQGLRWGPPSFRETVVRLPGLEVSVGEGCTGCGACLDVCCVQAISLHGDRVSVDNRCKGCGRCVNVCPTGALALRMDDTVDVLGHMLTRIERRTRIG